MNSRKAKELFKIMKKTVMGPDYADDLAKQIKSLITDSDGVINYHLLGIEEEEFEEVHRKARGSAHDLINKASADPLIPY